MKLLILIPAFNEEKTVGKVIKSLPKLEGFSEQIVLVVDDGSNDRTREIAEKAGAKVVSHRVNSGVGRAFQTGVNAALTMQVDIMITIDADGQFPAKKIPSLIAPILNGNADFVTATRFSKKDYYPKNIGKVKLLGNKIMAYLLSFILDGKYTDVSCGFRVYSCEAILNLNLFGQFTYTQEVFIDLSTKGLTIKEVPVGGVKYFQNRKSRVFRGAFNYAVKSLSIIFRTIRDYKPLKFFFSFGLGIFLIGLIADIVLLLHYLRSNQFSPYQFIGFIGGFLNIFGLILIIVGLLGGMIGRIRQNQEKLLYFEKKRYYYGQIDSEN